MGKIIKKITHFLGWSLFLLLLMGIGLSILINTPKVQGKVADKAFAFLGDMFGSRITYSEIKIGLFNKTSIRDLLILDQANDTLIFAPEFKASFPGLVKNIVLKKQLPVKINKLSFKDSYFRFYTDSLGNDNLKFFFDSLKVRKDTTKPPQPLYIHKIVIENSKFALLKYGEEEPVEGIDFTKMVCNNLDVKVKNFTSFADTLEMDIKQLHFIEKSGFDMEAFEGKLHLCNTHLYFDDVSMQLKDSDLALDQVHLDFDDFKDFANGGVFDKVKMKVDVKKSDVQMHEVGYFAPIFLDMYQKVEMKGNFHGYISNLNARKVEVKLGEGTRFAGTFDMTGLPDATHTFLFANISEFVTNVDDLNNLNLPRGKELKLPNALKNINSFSYKGNFTGFFRDFVSYGTLETEQGTIMTDVLFEPDSNNLVTFSGKIRTSSFNVGVLTQSPDLIGAISLDLDIAGQGKIDGGFDIDMNGDIQQFMVNQYNYSNIQIDGNFTDKRFNGNINIDDPNAKVEFEGLVDLSSEIRQYNFSANVFYAQLYNLNLHKRDPNYTGSFLINADLEGNSLDNINGNVRLLNSLFENSEAQIQVYDLELELLNDSVQNKLVLKSDLLDGSIEGKFDLASVHNEYISYAKEILPALPFNPQKEVLRQTCNFRYNLHFKNCLPVFQFFLPNYQIMPKTIIEGTFQRDSTLNASVHVESPGVNLNNNLLDNVVLNALSSGDTMHVDMTCEAAKINNRVEFDNFSFRSTIDSNKVAFETKWMNWDSLLYKGRVKGKLQFLNESGAAIKSRVAFDSSTLVINDSLWNLDEFNVFFDSTSFLVNNFQLKHEDEVFEINGALTQKPKDSLNFYFKNFDLVNLNNFTRSEKFKFGGILNGEVVVKDIEKPLVFAEMSVDSLALNNELIGNTFISSNLDNEREAVLIDANVHRGKLNTLRFEGALYPTKENELDMSLEFNKFKLGFVNPYLDGIFDNVRGIATGTLLLSGTVQNPKLNGELNLQKVALTVDYLQTRYTFTSSLSFANNNVVLNNIELNDKYGNAALLNGLIQTHNFKKLDLNLSLNAKKFLFLDTKLEDNEDFYGHAFASGLVRLNGETSNLKFDVAASTEPGTEFNIPLSGNEELAEYGFIKFVGADSANVEQEEASYDVKLSGIQLDINLKVTPEARVKLIFDPTIGDIIEATGEGDLRIGINEFNDLTIVGEYLIEEGEYQFALEDVLVNKKFIVNRGSSLRWTGDPIEADIDINTYYRVKASLNDLDYSETFTGNNTVDCELQLMGKLTKPNVSYDINLPYSEQETKDWVASKISTDEEKGKQFLSLLILRRFMYAGNSDDLEGNGVDNSNIAGVNASELLSNQLSNMLSQISNDFDVGISYSPGTELTSTELEVALSTQLLNDRLSINGSVDMKTNAETEEANTIVGDVDIDYKITKNGKVRARVFNRANEGETVINMSKYTQGAGIFYTEEFDRLREIFKKDKKKRKNKKQQPDEKVNSQAVRDDKDVPDTVLKKQE